MGLRRTGEGRLLRRRAGTPRHPPVPARRPRAGRAGAHPRGGARRPVGRALSALALRRRARPRDAGPGRSDGGPGVARAGGQLRGAVGPPDAGPPAARDPRCARRRRRLLRPPHGRAGRARPGHLRRCRPVVVCLCHREPLAVGAGGRRRRRMGHPVPARGAGRARSGSPTAWRRWGGCAWGGRTSGRRSPGSSAPAGPPASRFPTSCCGSAGTRAARACRRPRTSMRPNPPPWWAPAMRRTCC